MDERPKLYVIQEPAAGAERKILHFTGIRSHGPADARAVERPWPRQVTWRDLQEAKGRTTGLRVVPPRTPESPPEE